MSWIFTDTSPGVEKNHNSIITVATIKARVIAQMNYKLPEEDLKVRNTRKSKK